jgi:hypothetical protein
MTSIGGVVKQEYSPVVGIMDGTKFVRRQLRMLKAWDVALYEAKKR